MTKRTKDEQERIEERLKKIIAEIPEDGEWYKSGDEMLFDLGVEMLRLGSGLTEIEHHFTRVYWSIASEFGG